MNKTVNYYNQNADEYFRTTVQADLSDHYSIFLSHLNSGNIIVDAGCGSGRDSKFFAEHGFRVIAYDASEELSKKAKQLTGLDVKCSTFLNDGCSDNSVDGIWACASLLHLNKNELRNVLQHFCDALKTDGVLYASFKYGDHSFESEDGRFFELINEKDLPLFESVGFAMLNTWISQDKTGREIKWINILCKKQNKGISGNDIHYPAQNNA